MEEEPEKTDVEVDQLIELIDTYESQLKTIEEKISDILNTVPKQFPAGYVVKLEDLPPDTQMNILAYRNQALSIGTAALLGVSNKIQQLILIPEVEIPGVFLETYPKRPPEKLRKKLIDSFTNLMNTFISLMTKNIHLFKIDSIEIMIGLTPSITVRLKP
jgi:hypothetical protein